MSNRTLASFILAATAISSPFAFAADATSSSQRHATGSSLTREQVSQETLAARRSGSLQPAGEGVEARVRPLSVGTPIRDYVSFDAKLARARGELRPAGEAVLPLKFSASGSGQTRDQVNHETQAARLNGTLQPAGEAANL